MTEQLAQAAAISGTTAVSDMQWCDMQWSSRVGRNELDQHAALATSRRATERCALF